MFAHMGAVDGHVLVKRIGGEIPVRTSPASCID